MGHRQRAKLRPIIAVILFSLLAYAIFSRGKQQSVLHTGFTSQPGDAGYTEGGQHNNLSLNAAECARTFPGLTKEIDDFVSRGPFDLPFKIGVVLQGKVENGQVSFMGDLETHQANEESQ